jgi:hypothetical protein
MRSSPAEKLRIALPLLPHAALLHKNEARWAMARGHAADGPVPNFPLHLYLDALPAVEPERVTGLR